MTTISLNIGIDFGTRYTKVCVRNTDRGESEVVRLGRTGNNVDQALILSQVGICYDGNLFGGVTEDEWNVHNTRSRCALTIDFIKMRLAQLDNRREDANWYSSTLPIFEQINLGDTEVLENLCAYFLYRVIQRTRENAKGDKRYYGNTIDWSANIGVPVEYCDSPSLERFRKVLYLAWHLYERIDNHVGMTIYSLNTHLQEIRRLDFSKTPCFAIPEIKAAIYSYTNSRQARQGLYIFCDIGGGTVESVAFTLYNKQIDFLAGVVKPVGVNALVKQAVNDNSGLERRLEKEIVENEKKILNRIAEESSKHTNLPSGTKHIANKHRAILENVERARASCNKNREPDLYFLLTLIRGQYLIHRQVSDVVHTSRSKLKDENEISIFLGGGGKTSDYYRDTILSTHEAFKLGSSGIKTFRMLNVPVPKHLAMNGIIETHFHRFSVAYGLSIPDYDHDLLNSKLPSALPILIPPRPRQNFVPDSAQDDG
jgi:hypothetical protein